jgi:uncharacterized protein involved in exopolysaccharide biosynthesis
MRRTLLFAIRLYPREWRERYEPEFLALLDQIRPDWFTVLDVLKGGLLMQLFKPRVIVAGFGLCCAFLAFTASFAFPSTYVSTTTLLLRDPPLQVNNVRLYNLHLSQTLNSMAQQALTRASLAEIISKRNLYEQQRQRMSLEEVIEQMRTKDIRISNVVSFNTGTRLRPAFQLTFAAPDGNTAQLVTHDIATKLNEAQKNVAPDALLEVLDPPNLPLQAMFPARANFAIVGLLAGLGIGILYVWYRARRTLRSL